MSLTAQIQDDVKTALKAGEKGRVLILRGLVSELQKDAKEGPGDEQAVLRREKKRRIEAAEAFRAGGREDLATAEEAEAELVSEYLPAEMGDDELRAIVDQAVADSGAESVKDMGAVMKLAVERAAGRADGKRISGLVRERLS
ncbi:MAG: GatB/YqeY domain-containing protein [Baekduia sp.]